MYSFTIVAIAMCIVILLAYLVISQHKDKYVGKITTSDIERLELQPRYYHTKARTEIQTSPLNKMTLVDTSVQGGKPVATIYSASTGMDHIVRIGDRIGLYKAKVRNIKKGRVYLEIEYTNRIGHIYVLYKTLYNRKEFMSRAVNTTVLIIGLLIVPTAQSQALYPENAVDPFKPMIQKEEEEKYVVKEGATPLERYELSQMKLSAILKGNKTYALVVVPDGKGYVIEVGEPIGHGQEVKEISDKLYTEDGFLDFE